MILALVIIFFISWQQTKNIHRDPSTLINKYYRLKKTNPIAAHQALQILLAQDSTYLPALREMSSHVPTTSTIPKKTLYQQGFSLQFSHLYTEDEPLLKVSSPLTSPCTTCSEKPTQSSIQRLSLPKSKMKFRQSITPNHPSTNQVMRFKQAGYLAIKHHQLRAAIKYFSKAYALTHQPRLAMQLGYLYDTIDDKPKAYQFFKLATKSKDPTRALCAENAMTNLSGLQTKTLSKPYFSEAFFNPFSQSRFGLTVRPLVVRLGIEQPNNLQSRQYLFLRRTDDNRSKNLGELSQIYEDNVQIIGVGGQLTPIKGLPVVTFLETGAAYDLIYRNRNRWRGDVRTGLMYYDQFGARPAYFDKVNMRSHYYSDLYGEATYFSRYNNNVIAGVKTHQGIRLLQYHTSMLSLYATGRMIADTKREFFNNFAEVGPGVEFIPNNRLNLKVLFEHVNGVYLPAGATPNPYGKYYKNTLVQLLLYVKI